MHTLHRVALFDKIRIIYIWAALPSVKREAISSSTHGNEIGCSLRPYCKFKNNLSLYAIWLVAVKNIMPLKT